jgi:tetratricopeptide (TPR) repeat protein
MYALNFQEAELEFFRWQQEHAADPLGPASRAANLLFSEFDRQGVLQAQFFVDDASFKSRAAVSPDPQLKRRFELALGQAEALARQRVAKDAGDREALFALALVYGLRADYAALIEKRNWSSLGYTRDASEYATKLLAIAPDYYDAYLATGISQYIVGSLVAPVRWVAHLAGYKGDKAQGIQELKLTAERGRYLAPFARILLAIVYLRQRDTAQARELLVKLRDDFPSNPLFAQEVHRIDLLRR